MSSSLYTLADAREVCGRFVESGSCDTDLQNKRITEACRRLLVKADWPYSTQIVRIRTDNQTFPLPRECVSIRWARVCDSPVSVRNMSYEFMASGPGEIKHGWSGSGIKDPIDIGMFPVMYDLPSPEVFAAGASITDRTLGEGLYIVAFSTEIADISLETTIYGNNKYLNDVDVSSATSFVPGDAIRINRWHNGVEGSIAFNSWDDIRKTTGRYRQITKWIKPTTKGYISLYGVDPDTNYMYFLGKAHPDDTAPAWRRYKLLNQGVTDAYANILALCKMKALPLTRDDDILPIQNLDAIKLMIIAIREENALQMANAIAYEQNAVRLLTEQMEDHQVSGGVPVIIDTEAEHALGPSVGMGYMIL